MRGEGNHKIPGSFAPENMEKTGAERVKYSLACQHEDAIPIKFVSYAQKCPTVLCTFAVALRKESVDRNDSYHYDGTTNEDVALRKESVDRNSTFPLSLAASLVALRKESVDRNSTALASMRVSITSLSARRAWIEMCPGRIWSTAFASLSARRAWIEIYLVFCCSFSAFVALRKESVDRNFDTVQIVIVVVSRSPQGERG